MHSDPFERDIAGLFAVPPAFDDNEAFVRRGAERLETYERLRRRVLMAVGVIAAVLAGLMAARAMDLSRWAALTQDLGAQAASTPLTTWCVLAAAAAGAALLLGRATLAR